MLTQEQRDDIYWMGNNDGYVNEVLQDCAKIAIENKYDDISEDDLQEAIGLYCNGFYGMKEK